MYDEALRVAVASVYEGSDNILVEGTLIPDFQG